MGNTPKHNDSILTSLQQTDSPQCGAGQRAVDRYQELLAAMPDLMFRIRRDGTYVDFHAPEGMPLWREPHEFLGKRIHEVFPGEYARQCMACVEKTFASGTVQMFEFRGWGDFAHEYWEARFCVCAPDEVLVLAREISDRRRAEEDLLRRERYLRSMFETAVDPLWDWDVARDVAAFSPSWPRMLGYEPEEFDPTVLTWESLLHPDDQPHVSAALERCLRGDTSHYEAEYRVRHRDGTWRWAFSRGKVIERGAGNVPLRMIGSIRDMTARRRAEEEARRSEERQRVLLRELDHRVRNNLASLMALIDISCHGAKDVAELAASMRSRVQAMSTTHVMLTRSHLSPLDLRRVLTAMIPSELLGSVELNGPEVFISARQSTALGMVIQELVTNSMKYGSLSTRGGRVEATWNIHGEPAEQKFTHLELTWREHAGPAIREPVKPGVGTTLINGLVRTELRGSAELTYPESGAVHTLTLRLDAANEDPFNQ